MASSPLDRADALRTPRTNISETFAASPAGPIPTGRGEGSVLIASGGPFARPINSLARALFWQGKEFDPSTGELMNLLSPFGLRAIRAKVYEAPSLLDGDPCIVLDYSATSTIARPIRDEIREVSPGNYLGTVYIHGRRVPVEFWLSFDESNEAPLQPSHAFALESRSAGWAESAPIRLQRNVALVAKPEAVFEVLADHEGWPSWFKGMRRVRIDGKAAGVGALRTVWVGASRVQEDFIVWDNGERLTFNIVASNLPGLRAMQEDWRLSASETGSLLTITIGVEAAGPLRSAHGLVEAIVARSTKGASEIASLFR